MLDVLRGIVRPIITIVGFFSLTALAVLIVLRESLPEAILVGIVAAFMQTVGMATAFWFAGRTPPSNGAPH